MSEFYQFRARAFFVVFGAIFCAFLISDNSEAGYSKDPIWKAQDNGYEGKGNNNWAAGGYEIENSDLSSDGKYIVRSEEDITNYYNGDYIEEESRYERLGYNGLAVYYYNNSYPDNVFHECILGNNYQWNGACNFRSVGISGDGSNVAAIVSYEYGCYSSGNYDYDGYNATGPCSDFYTKEQKDSGWIEGNGYSGQRYEVKLVIYDGHSGILQGEYSFCYTDGYDRYSTDYYYCQGIVYSDYILELSTSGNNVIAGVGNQLFGFTVSDISSGPDWSFSYSNHLAGATISDEGDIVGVIVGEFLHYYNTGALVWKSHLFGQAKHLDMSGDGTKISVATDYMIVYSFTSTSPIPTWEYAHYRNIRDIVVSASGSHILVSSDSGLLYFNHNSNTPLWLTDENSYGNFISMSSNGMMLFVGSAFINSINGNIIWETSSGSGFISDAGNFVYTTNGYFYTVDSQIFYPIAIAGDDTTKKTSQVVQFTGQGTDQDGEIRMFEWDFDGNGVYDWYSYSNGLYTYFYNNEGTYTASLRVTDNDGLTSTDTIIITITGVVTGELIDPKDEDDDDSSLDNGETEPGKNTDTSQDPPKGDDDDDEGFLPSLGIVASIGVIGIIGWIRRYK